MAREILVADQDKSDQEELQRIFEGTDYRLVFSENGEDALLRVKLFKPDLVIAEAASGLELCEAVKSDSEFRHVPVVLLAGMFEEVSERDRTRVGADGVVSKPLREGEILGLVESLIEKKGSEMGGDRASEKEWDSLSDLENPGSKGKPGAAPGGLDNDEEEIIELVDVVEEPEARMSIDDFISPAKTKPESIGDIAPLESWDKIFEEEKKPGKPAADAEPPEESLTFSIEEEKETGPAADLSRRKTEPPDELFEKIELEEILEKVEQLKPAIEKEWPSDEEISRKIGETLREPEPEAPKKWMEIESFETALRTEVKGAKGAMAPEAAEEGLAPFTLDEPMERARAGDKAPEKETFDGFDLEAFMAEEKAKPRAPEKEPEAFTLEDAEEEPAEKPGESMFDEIQAFIRDELRKGAPAEAPPQVPGISGPAPAKQAVAAAPVQPVPFDFEEEPLAELEEEALPEAWIEELGEDEIRGIEEHGRERAEEVRPVRESTPPGIPVEVRMEPPDLISREPSLGFIDEAEAPRAVSEERRLEPRVSDRQLEEVIGKGVQEMMEGFITKVLPQMTQNILNLTVERIETMVKEVVPDLAEKAIQEEIRRIQKGEKD